jgi:hypothetical protein
MKANDLSQFSFKKVSSGCYKVAYCTPNYRNVYIAYINDMTIIDATLNADVAKIADIKWLRHICVATGSKKRIY